MVAENRKLKVFLFHSKDDKPKVRELYHRLVADGFDAWLDEEKLIPGQEWDLEIRKAVRESDLVVVCLSNSSTTEARNGEMVAIRVEDEYTLKYFFEEKEHYRLQPANPTMEPILVKKNIPIEINGKVVMVIRKMLSMWPISS